MEKIPALEKDILQTKIVRVAFLVCEMYAFDTYICEVSGHYSKWHTRYGSGHKFCIKEDDLKNLSQSLTILVCNRTGGLVMTDSPVKFHDIITV